MVSPVPFSDITSPLSPPRRSTTESARSPRSMTEAECREMFERMNARRISQTPRPISKSSTALTDRKIEPKKSTEIFRPFERINYAYTYLTDPLICSYQNDDESIRQRQEVQRKIDRINKFRSHLFRMHESGAMEENSNQRMQAAKNYILKLYHLCETFLNEQDQIKGPTQAIDHFTPRNRKNSKEIEAEQEVLSDTNSFLLKKDQLVKRYTEIVCELAKKYKEENRERSETILPIRPIEVPTPRAQPEQLSFFEKVVQFFSPRQKR